MRPPSWSATSCGNASTELARTWTCSTSGCSTTASGASAKRARPRAPTPTGCSVVDAALRGLAKARTEGRLKREVEISTLAYHETLSPPDETAARRLRLRALLGHVLPHRAVLRPFAGRPRLHGDQSQTAGRVSGLDDRARALLHGFDFHRRVLQRQLAQVAAGALPAHHGGRHPLVLSQRRPPLPLHAHADAPVGHVDAQPVPDGPAAVERRDRRGQAARRVLRDDSIRPLRPKPARSTETWNMRPPTARPTSITCT